MVLRLLQLRLDPEGVKVILGMIQIALVLGGLALFGYALVIGQRARTQPWTEADAAEAAFRRSSAWSVAAASLLTASILVGMWKLWG